MYIEPCCVDNELPRLLRQSGGSAVLFQTSGDVTLEHLMKAVMLMVGDRPRVMTLAVPSVDAEVLALLQRYLRLEWVARLRLITSEPEPIAAQKLLSMGVDSARLQLSIVDDARPLGLLMFAGPNGTVAIQGHLESTTHKGFHLYAALFGPSGSPTLRSYTDPLDALIKARQVELKVEEKPEEQAEAQPMAAAEPEVSTEAEQPMVEEEPPAARSGGKRKNRVSRDTKK
jgi:hypothetical protein